MIFKKIPIIRFLIPAVFAALVACVPTDPREQIPEGTGFVRITSTVGPFAAEATAQIYAGDVAVYYNRSSAGRERVRLVTLRAGAFERLSAVSLDAVARLLGTSDFDPTCGHQLHVIEVSEHGGEPIRVQTACRSESFEAAQGELRRMLDAEIVE